MEKMTVNTIIFSNKKGAFKMEKLCKTKLIKLTKKYISIPISNAKIVYKCYYGTSKISFFKSENNNLYHVEAEFTYFCNEYVLNIEQYNCSNKEDFKRTFIKLGPTLPT